MLRDGIWTLEGPHAVIGRLDAEPTLLAVVDEQDAQVRVVYEGRTARIARWIRTADLHLTVLRPVALAGRADSYPRTERAAVLLLPGVPVAELRHAGARVQIAAGDDELHAEGWIDADLLGRIWIGEPYPDDPEATHGVDGVTPILLEPSDTATAVAITQRTVKAALLGERGDWAEVQIVGSWMNVHGYVPSGRLHLGPPGDYELTGQLSQPSEWPDVPAGTCLVESIGGAIIGVTTEAHPDQEPVPGGAKVPVETPWGPMKPFAEEAGDGWRACPIRNP